MNKKQLSAIQSQIASYKTAADNAAKYDRRIEELEASADDTADISAVAAEISALRNQRQTADIERELLHNKLAAAFDELQQSHNEFIRDNERSQVEYRRACSRAADELISGELAEQLKQIALAKAFLLKQAGRAYSGEMLGFSLEQHSYAEQERLKGELEPAAKALTTVPVKPSLNDPQFQVIKQQIDEIDALLPDASEVNS